MKIGLQISEQEYRALPYPSYSLLSNISKHGPNALRGPYEDISDLDGVIVGSLVDSIITDGGLPDNLVVIDKKPSAKPLDIIKAVASRVDELSDKKNILSVKNSVILEEELNRVAYYSGLNIKDRIAKLKKYNKYASALADTSAFIVSSYQHRTAITLSNILISKYEWLSDTENLIPQVKIVGTFQGIKVKGMLDFIYIDHENKIVKPYDLKTGIGPHNGFFDNGFLGFNYYLQASLYRSLLAQEITDNHPELEDYEIDDFRFMYCGRLDKLPIIYKTTPKWYDAGWEGFTYEGIKYPGLVELLEAYIYYVTHPNSFYLKGYETEEVVFNDTHL